MTTLVPSRGAWERLTKWIKITTNSELNATWHIPVNIGAVTGQRLLWINGTQTHQKSGRGEAVSFEEVVGSHLTSVLAKADNMVMGWLWLVAKWGYSRTSHFGTSHSRCENFEFRGHSVCWKPGGMLDSWLKMIKKLRKWNTIYLLQRYAEALFHLAASQTTRRLMQNLQDNSYVDLSSRMAPIPKINHREICRKVSVTDHINNCFSPFFLCTFFRHSVRCIGSVSGFVMFMYTCI